MSSKRGGEEREGGRGKEMMGGGRGETKEGRRPKKKRGGDMGGGMADG